MVGGVTTLEDFFEWVQNSFISSITNTSAAYQTKNSYPKPLKHSNNKVQD